MKKILVSLLLITVLMVPAAALAQDVELEGDQPADPALNQQSKVVATVNGEEISSQMLEQQANVNQVIQQVARVDRQLAQILASTEAGSQVMEELKKAKLDSVIDSFLLKQAAEESEITLTEKELDDIYQKRKTSIMQQNKWDEEQYLAKIKEQGYKDEAAFKEQLTSNPSLKINKLVEEEVLADIEISEAELKEAYDSRKDAIAQSGQDTSFEKIKPQLKRLLKQQQQSRAVNAYLEKLREEAEIEKNI